MATLYARTALLLAAGGGANLPRDIWVVDWLDRGGMTPVTKHLAQQGAAGWGVFLMGKIVHAAFCLALPMLAVGGQA